MYTCPHLDQHDEEALELELEPRALRLHEKKKRPQGIGEEEKVVVVEHLEQAMAQFVLNNLHHRRMNVQRVRRRLHDGDDDGQAHLQLPRRVLWVRGVNQRAQVPKHFCNARNRVRRLWQRRQQQQWWWW